MKKNIFAIMLLMVIALGANAQAFERGGRYHNISLGAAVYNYPEYSSSSNFYGVRYRYRPLVGMLNYQLEFGVHEYVGVGLTTGIGGRGAGSLYNAGLVVPVGVMANFHFYQLIDDKVSKDIHADKLDIYAGLNVGSGIAYFSNSYADDITPIWFMGPHVGARYYFSDRISVNVETGYGKSYFNAGITIRSGN